MIYTECIYDENIEFEWDESKNQSNIEKHGIDFLQAAKTFRTVYMIETIERMFLLETRYKCLSQFNEDVLSIIYTIRANKIRIISARKASRQERRRFYEKEK